jgi:hypothetical protein
VKTFLFIDGTNLYAGQYELFGPKKYLVFSSHKNRFTNQQKIVIVKLNANQLTQQVE